MKKALLTRSAGGHVASQLAAAYLGPLQFDVLSAVANSSKPLNAVNIWEEVKANRDSSITSGGIYTVLGRLRGRGLLDEQRETKSSGRGRPKVFYTITKEGRSSLEKERERLKKQLESIGSLTQAVAPS